MNILLLVFVIIAAVVSTVNSDGSDIYYTTSQRITSFNYPAETHTVQTVDGYVLTMFRIPYSRKEQKSSKPPRPIAFLQHGLLSSSDSFILNGPDNALAYLLADAGYDVWLGNSRGNTYSRKNVNILANDSKFWDFSWHELGIRDLPAMIDYVLHNTNQEKLHYVGHSQGTTSFLVLMSEIPSYNSKIKTSHMLAPIGFMNHAQSPTILIGGLFFGHPSILSDLLSKYDLFPNYDILAIIGSLLCANGSRFQWICADLLFVAGGFDSKHFNYTLLPQIAETHPAGCSTNQFFHYLQEYISGEFRKYDHGKEKNKKIYGQNSPPKYMVQNIVAPIRFYYGDNDLFAAVSDIKRMEKILPNLAESYDIPVKAWNHFDFLFAIDVKKFINDKIINTLNHFEKTGKQL